MRMTLSDLASWPVRRNDQPIFTSTQEAYLYAQLIWDNAQIIGDLNAFHQDTLVNLKYERSCKDPKLMILADLTCRALFFRQCLEEVQRIKEET